MKLKYLRVYNFRNHKEKEVFFDGKNSVFIGKTGTGKTSLLEAINLFSTGTSFRTNKEKELIKKGEKEAKVEIIFEKENEDIKEEWYFKNGKPFFKVNGEIFKKRKNILGKAFFIISSPEDKAIINGEPEKRRNFIDTVIFSKESEYYTTLLKYRKCLKNRNILLKRKNEKELKVWDELISEFGEKIIQKREEEIKKKNKEAGKIFSFFNKENKLKIKYCPSIKKENNEESLKEQIKKELGKNKEKDFEFQSTTKGPHKDEIEILLDGYPAKSYASQGQKKLICLAMMLSEQKERKEKAVFLFDEIFSELDLEKKEKILDYIKENQAVITATEKTVVKNFNKIIL